MFLFDVQRHHVRSWIVVPIQRCTVCAVCARSRIRVSHVDIPTVAMTLLFLAALQCKTRYARIRIKCHQDGCVGMSVEGTGVRIDLLPFRIFRNGHQKPMVPSTWYVCKWTTCREIEAICRGKHLRNILVRRC